jgi:hypothetical protein
MTIKKARATAGKHTHTNSTPKGIDALLSRLERVKRTSATTWLASCPTRDDKHPSMTIRLLDDGRILIHDHGGDSTADILAAIGLTFDSLYPDTIDVMADPRKPERRPFHCADVLRAVGFEILVVGVAASAIASGEPLAVADRDRLKLAVSRIDDALELAGVRRHG